MSDEKNNFIEYHVDHLSFKFSSMPLLGSGSFGEVRSYKLQSQSSLLQTLSPSSPVHSIAVKKFFPDVNTDDHHRHFIPISFLREWETHCRIRPPHTIPLYGYQIDLETFDWFLFMKQADCSVEDHLLQNTVKYADRFNIAQSVFRRGLELLKCLHTHCTVYRDIKPSNILIIDAKLDPTNIVFADICGKIQIEHSKDDTSSLYLTQNGCTSWYTPPEYLNSTEYTYSSDLYCLAICCIHILSDLEELTVGQYDEIPCSVWHSELDCHLRRNNELNPNSYAVQFLYQLRQCIQLNPRDRMYNYFVNNKTHTVCNRYIQTVLCEASPAEKLLYSYLLYSKQFVYYMYVTGTALQTHPVSKLTAQNMYKIFQHLAANDVYFKVKLKCIE